MPLPDTAPPPIGPRSLAIAVAVQGGDAYAAGQPVNACPYGPDRPYSRRAWVLGYVGAAMRAGATLAGDTVEDVDVAAPFPDAPEVSSAKP